jgi:hypothetical protein
MRHPRRDELWDRTPGGVIVPRRVGLPTRRFIGKLGMVVDCCGGQTCETFCANHPDTIYADFAELDLAGRAGGCSEGDCNLAETLIAADYTSAGGYCSQWYYQSSTPPPFCSSGVFGYHLSLNVILYCEGTYVEYVVMYGVNNLFVGGTNVEYRANLTLSSQTQAQLFAAGIVCDYYSSGVTGTNPCTITSYPDTVTIYT